MQLKKLEIAGFKSFGARKIFEFHNGITAIVGPNGSGKSNIADAIRWVLGEQKSRRLRIGRAEDIIFFGTKARPKASMAEVTIYLENNSSKSDFDVDEIELSRRLLRSGESEYRLNGRKTKLVKIEEVLAQAGFGTETYTVIGQGMIDQLLTATGAERKLLFDEASGIRQYDIRRGTARRNLKTASDNLERVQGILTELKPAVAVLQKQAANHQKAETLKLKITQAKQGYLDGSYTQNCHKLLHYDQLIAEHKSNLSIVLQKIQNLHSAVRTSEDVSKKSESQKKALKAIEIERDSLSQKLLLIKSELAVLIAKQKELQPEVEFQRNQEKQIDHLSHQLTLLNTKHSLHNDKILALQDKINNITEELAISTVKLNNLQQQLQKSQKKEFVNHALGLVQLIRVQLRQGGDRRAMDQTMHKLSHMLELALEDDAAKLATELIKTQHSIAKLMATREEITEIQTEKTIILRSIELDITKLESDIANLKKEHTTSVQKTSLLEKIQQDIVKHENLIATQQLALDNTTQELSVAREKLFAIAKGGVSADIQDFEVNASEKTRLELEFNRLIDEKAAVTRQNDDLQSLAIKWYGKKYKFTKSQPSKYVSLGEIDLMQAELTAVEDIDPQSIKEARESADRIEFLQHQQKDLERAISDTTTLIASLEKDMKQKFQSSFKKINTVFGEFFAKLFLGGSASLQLTQEDDEFGIEIVVQPPGKRGKSITALSGGEKAMASIALLAAIIQTNPSPFIVLDEVDAALDDTNSGRFTKVLDELSKHSQLLVITHNHETMQSAHNLFGITTTPKGDSEVLQLSLQNAQEYATT